MAQHRITRSRNSLNPSFPFGRRSDTLRATSSPMLANRCVEFQWAVVEPHHTLRPLCQVGHDEPYPRKQLAAMPLHFGEYAARVMPGLRLVLDAVVEHLGLPRRSPHRTLQQVLDLPLQHSVPCRSQLSENVGQQETWASNTNSIIARSWDRSESPTRRQR